MMSLAQKITIVAALVAFVEARFGQEQIPVAAVQALDGQFGASGEAATLAGSIPSSLLAAASPCDKLALADQIAALGDDPAVLAAAIGLVSAETNFNPFAVDKPFVCADPALPATAALRGITPLVDPDVTDAGTANAASAASVGSPFAADGLSQADVMIAQGFTTFQAVDASGANIELDGQAGGAAGGNAGGNAGNAGDDAAEADAGNGNAGNGNAGNGNAGNDNANDNANAGNGCGGGNANAGNGNAGNDNANDNAGNDNANDNAGNQDQNQDDNAGDNGNNGNGNDNQNQDDDAGDNGNNGNDNQNQDDNAGDDAGAGNNAGGNADFGECTPTMDLQGGRNGRPADELTFLPTDPLVAEGQQEALNPNIITNRICDQLGNVCGANDAAIQLCTTTQAQIEALGTRDQSTADTWNAALGF